MTDRPATPSASALLIGITKREWPRMFGASLIAFAAVGSSIGLAMASGVLITRAALYSSVADLGLAVVGVRLFGITRGAFRYLERLIAHQIALRLLENARVRFFSILRPLIPMATRDLARGEILHALARDIDDLEFIYARAIAPPLVFLWTSLLMCVFLTHHGWFYTGCFGVCALAIASAHGIAWPFLRHQVNLSHSWKRSQENLSIELIRGAAELRVLGMENAWRADALNADRHLRQATERTQNLLGALESWSMLIMSLGALLILYRGIQDTTNALLSPVSLISILLGVISSGEAAQNLPQSMLALAQIRTSARSLIAITRRKEPVHYPETPIPIQRDTPPDMQLRRMCFHWDDPTRLDNAQINILRNISFALRPGQKIALTGPSGSGKSTLAHLLVRLLDPTQGQILCQQIPLRRFHPEDIRRSVLLIDQAPHLFTGTLADNLRLIEPSLDNAQIDTLLFRVGLELPADTWVGERGAQLSGGQRQRLAIAQALCRMESPDAPQILILDEPAAHLPEPDALRLTHLFLRHPKRFSLIVITHKTHLLPCFREVVHISGH